MVDPHPQTAMEKQINAILGDLIAQRRLLQGSPADRALLASNGASIAYWQSKLRQAPPDLGISPGRRTRLVERTGP
jgi:hypothetical protein